MAVTHVQRNMAFGNLPFDVGAIRSVQTFFESDKSRFSRSKLRIERSSLSGRLPQSFTNGLRIFTPSIACPSFKSSEYSVAQLAAAAAARMRESQNDSLLRTEQSTASWINSGVTCTTSNTENVFKIPLAAMGSTDSLRVTAT